MAFIDHLMNAEYETAYREARRFRAPDMPWDPLLRATAAGHLDNRPAMVAAWGDEIHL